MFVFTEIYHIYNVWYIHIIQYMSTSMTFVCGIAIKKKTVYSTKTRYYVSSKIPCSQICLYLLEEMILNAM